MDQKKLHKTIETIASKKFPSDEELLKTVLSELVVDSNLKNVIGGRIWKLIPELGGYKLLYQCGKIQRMSSDLIIRIKDYPTFELISKERTILGNETHELLRKKGIFKFSASGLGFKSKVDGKPYFDYILALNSDAMNEELRITLSIITTALTSQIKQRRYAVSANNLKADIDKARQLQKSILPEHEYKFFNYDIYGLTYPAEIVGGDFFDYLEVGDSKEVLGITLGDAASKGVAAAAEAMYLSGALRMASNFEIKISPLMQKMNQLVNKIFEDDKFISVFYGELIADEKGLFLYANAGHNPPVFLKNVSNKVEFLNPTGPVLGPAPQAKYTIESVSFDIGDIMVLFSDGITEAMNLNFEEFGEKRLIKIIRKNKDKTPKEIVYIILDEVIKFSRNGQYSDDKTLVVIKRNR
ncbi:MAG: PP2C family protein-serine/threonine phosphatase [Ignavibacteriaceae bacterium]